MTPVRISASNPPHNTFTPPYQDPAKKHPSEYPIRPQHKFHYGCCRPFEGGVALSLKGVRQPYKLLTKRIASTDVISTRFFKDS